MDKITMFLAVIAVASIISFCVSISYLPQIGGIVPDGMDASEYSRQQNQGIINSLAFKISMGSLGSAICSTIYCIVRFNTMSSEMVLPGNEAKGLKSILKTSRISPAS